ncbi:MAG: 3-hydroxybutyryl-CoA dehydrogenase [bacterium]|nr:3-hydroxybutyryl-CoA dehydrogenase [bacterium]
MPTFSSVAVLGAGTMGSGIAQLCAQAGSTVYLFDAFPEALKRAPQRIEKDLAKAVELGKLAKGAVEQTMARIRPINLFEECKAAELVIEAVSESLDLKVELFAQLDDHLSGDAILATNTSSLSVTQIAARTKYPHRVCGMHFFNPATRMKLIEVVAAHQTDKSVIERITAYAIELEKIPVVTKDTPGFIVNRVARPYYGEALRALGEGLADHLTIDRIMREGGGFKMGPFELMDLIGIDINFAATSSVWEAYFRDSRYRPHPIQKQMVDAGYLGKKSGRGFYDYSAEGK